MRDSKESNIQGRRADSYDGPADGFGYGGPSSGYGGPSSGYDGPSNGCDPAHSYDGPSRYDEPATEIPTLPARGPRLAPGFKHLGEAAPVSGTCPAATPGLRIGEGQYGNFFMPQVRLHLFRDRRISDFGLTFQA